MADILCKVCPPTFLGGDHGHRSKSSGCEDALAKIFRYTGQKYKPEIAEELWPKILQHKWILSEKLGRDAGIKVACLDYIENVDVITEKQIDEDKTLTLRELGAQLVDRAVWDTISESQPPKQIIEKRVILPLTEIELAQNQVSYHRKP